MPNYPTHARWGRVGAAVVAVALAVAVYALSEAPVLAGLGAVGAAVATFAGSIYPDVDHHKSIPRRKAVRGFQAVTALGVLGLAAANWDRLLAVGESAAGFASVPPVVAALAIAAAGMVVALALVDPVLGAITREHRGWTHSTVVNLVLVAALAAAVWLLTAERAPVERLTAVAVTGSFYLGALIHLWLDGEIV